MSITPAEGRRIRGKRHPDHRAGTGLLRDAARIRVGQCRSLRRNQFVDPGCIFILADDPHIRQQLARLYTGWRIGAWNADRAKAAGGGTGAAIANLGKIIQTDQIKGASSLAIDILGADGMLAGADGEQGGRFAKAMVFSPASSIYGGTDEIQRNIVAERVLGLPREQLPGRGEPYDEVLRSLGRRG